MSQKRRCLMVFDGAKVICRDEMRLHSEWEVRGEAAAGEAATAMSDLDYWTIKRAEAFLDEAPSRGGCAEVITEVRC